MFGKKPADNSSYTSYHALINIALLINTHEAEHCKEKNKYILGKFLALPHRESLRQKQYIIYKTEKNRDVPVAEINPETSKIRDIPYIMQPT